MESIGLRLIPVQMFPQPACTSLQFILQNSMVKPFLHLLWRRTGDPEDKTFVDTTNALPVVGGIIGYIGAAAPTASVPYLTVITTMVVRVRGRKI